MKIGILGGTFDPVHRGHLMIAAEAMDSLRLSEVVFIPAGLPVFKAESPVTPAEQRLEMLRLAVTDSPRFRISTIEMERPGPSYTVDTIAELSKLHRGDELYFILGWDSLLKLPSWREPSRLVGMCRLVGVPRPGCARPDLEALEADIPSISQRVTLLDKPQVDISASKIRELTARGEPIEKLVPLPVAEYIRSHKLYLYN